MTILETFKKIDFLGKRPTLIVYKNESHKSLVGGLLSVLTILIFLLAVGYFLFKLISRNTFTLLQSEALDRNQTFIIDQNLLYLEFGYLLHDNDFDYDRVLDIYAEYRDGDGEFQKSSLKKCDKNDIINIIGQDYENHIRKNNSLYCIQNNLFFEKNTIKAESNQFAILLNFCQNNTRKNDCFSKETIFKLVDNTFLLVNYKNLIIDDKNFEDPGNPEWDYIYNPINPQETRIIEMEINPVKYSTDSNFLFSDPYTQNYFNYVFKESSGLGNMLRINIKLPPTKKRYERKFYNLPSMLAEVGGLLSLILKILSNVNAYFSNQLFYEDLINSNLNSLCLNIEPIKSKLHHGHQSKHSPIMLKDVNCLNNQQNSKNSLIKPTTNSKHLDKSIDSKTIHRNNNKKDLIFASNNVINNDNDNNQTPGQEKKYDAIKTEEIKLNNNSDTFINDKPKIIFYDLYRSNVDSSNINSDRKQENNSIVINENEIKCIRCGKCENEKSIPVLEEEKLNKLNNSSNSPDKEKGIKMKNDENKQNNELTHLSKIAAPNQLSTRKKFKLSFCITLFPKFCFGKKSKSYKSIKLFKNLSEIINEQRDFVYMTEKWHTLDKIQHILCGNEHKDILKSAFNPYLNIQDLSAHKDDAGQAPVIDITKNSNNRLRETIISYMKINIM